MSDDWAMKYIDIHKQKQQEKRDTQEKARLARSVAPDMFQRIKNRIQRDLETLHNAGVLQSVQFSETAMEKFAVSAALHSSQPRGPILVAELDSVIIKYVYAFPNDAGDSVPTDAGTLRICSDLGGTAQVYRNGSGKAFADESDVSEFLLRHVLEYVDSH